MTDLLRDMSQATLVRVVEENLTEFHAFLSGWPEVTLHRGDDRIWTVSHENIGTIPAVEISVDIVRQE